jgi:hypothetical protein
MSGYLDSLRADWQDATDQEETSLTFDDWLADEGERQHEANLTSGAYYSRPTAREDHLQAWAEKRALR